MQLLLKNKPNAGYETGDVIAIMPDSHQWGSGELSTNSFTIIKNVSLTEDEAKRILEPEYQVVMPKSAHNIKPLMKRLIIDNLVMTKKVTHKYVNGELVRK